MARPGIRGTELPAEQSKEGAYDRHAGRSVGFTGGKNYPQVGMITKIAHIVINVNTFYANIQHFYTHK